MAPPPAQAEEIINWFGVIGIGLGSLIVFAIATFVVWKYMNAREKVLQPGGAAAVPARAQGPPSAERWRSARSVRR